MAAKDNQDWGRADAVERHAQTVLITIGLGLSTWGLVSINKTQQDVASMASQLKHLQLQVQLIDGRFAAYLPVREADARQQTVQAQIEAISARTEYIEREVRGLR